MRKNQKPALSKDLILETGLQLAATEGVDAISFRKLATRLDVTPMALYRYFTNKEDLLGELLDQFIRHANVLPEKTMIWDDWLMYVANKMFEALRDEPGWILVFKQIQLKPTALEVMDTCLQVLLSAGFNKEQSVKAFIGMIHCMLGACLMHSNIQAESALTAKNLDIENYQHMTNAYEELITISEHNQIVISMELLIEGLRCILQKV